jgi:tetratricopeptide (TPR) repeat protein
MSLPKRLLALIAPVALLAGCFSSSDRVQRAEELSRQGDYDAAIALYREHMEARLAIEDRPEWENPYFYLLLIGDVQLGRGEPEAALQTYEEAERQKVEPTLISDRYRAVGRWYEEHGQLQKALEELSKYRDRDPLLFDVMLDRIAKKLTAQEDAASKPAAAKAAATPALADH